MRHVLLFGKAGMIVLASLSPEVPMALRLYVPPNAARPKANCGKDYSDQVLMHVRLTAAAATHFCCLYYVLRFCCHFALEYLRFKL